MRIRIVFLVFVLTICLFSLIADSAFDVKVIYFKPSDAGDIDIDKHDRMLKDIQRHYQSEMTRHGYKDYTFPLELDNSGKLIIHVVNGKHKSVHYDNRPSAYEEYLQTIKPELPFKFNNDLNVESRDVVHLIIVGGVTVKNWGDKQGMGFTWLHGRFGGIATIKANSLREFPNHYLALVAHELGHAFALDPGHNGHQDTLNGTIIAFGQTTEDWGDRMKLLKFEADFLKSRPIFREINLDDNAEVEAEQPNKNSDLVEEQVQGEYDMANVLMYTGDVSWMSLEDAKRQSQITKQLLSSEGIRAEVVQTEDSVRDWMLQTTSDGNVDVLILYGTLPTSIYPSGNSQPDGSVAENWIESTDGNTILNHGDYFGYVSSDNVYNNVQALQAIMDIPHITMWDFGTQNNTPMVVTKDGKEITPSLTNFKSDRAFHLDELTGDWFAEKVLASDTGTSQANRADPVIVRDGNRGRIGIVYQTFNEANPKGKVAAELITNFLLRNSDKISSPPLEPITDNDTGNRSDTVSLLPASVQSPNIGQQLNLSLKITNGKNVAGYQATVQFDDTALRYVESKNSDYLSGGGFFVDSVLEGSLVKLNAASLAGESEGDGTLATLTFEVIAVKASTLTLSDVLLSNSRGETFAPLVENAEITEPTKLIGDVNSDGTVNIADLVLVASNLGETGPNAADVNSDGVVNIADLVLVAGALGTSAAPSIHPQTLEMFTAIDVKQWVSAAQQLNLTDMNSQRGILFLQQLLVALTPKETALLPNFPNPFNPETWIPYHLAKDADVTLHIYTINGAVVRTLPLGYQAAGKYQNRSRAAYWDGKNTFGEPVASGLYFYTLTAGDFTATRQMLIQK